MQRNVATAVASRRTVRRRVITTSERECTGSRNHVAPKSHYARDRCERDDNEYSRPNKVAILNQNRDHLDCSQSKKSKFKSNYYSGNQFHKSWQNKADLVREQLNGEFFQRNKQIFRNRSLSSYFPKRNYTYGNGNFRNSSWVLKESFSGWYAIHVLNVEESDEVTEVIQRYIKPVQFHPYNIHFFDDTNTLVFVVDDFKIAKILQNVNGKIKLHNQRLGIRVKHFWPRVPCVSVSSKVREKMAQEIVNRHNPQTKCLDLSHFHACQLFTENQLFLPLNQPLFLMVALKIVAEYVKHDLYGLSLKNNHIYLDEGLVWIRRLFPGLKVLDLGNNKLTEVNALKSLSGFTIEELNLSMNPVNNTEDENYKQKVQQLFPVLKKLNNSELQCRYSGIVDLKLKIPINHDYSYPIPKRHDLKVPNPVITFVEFFLSKFFERYDKNMYRQLVNEAYHDNSIFTLSSDKLLSFSNGHLSKYISESRNLLILTQKTRKNCFLHRGKENILKIFEKLPKTKHDLDSFQIDVPLANSKMVQIVLNGVFAENYDESDYRHVFRSFCRTFFIVPNGSSWCILSDMLFVTVVSNEIKMESVKRFNALKQSNIYNFNGNKTNNMIMFMDDSDKTYHLESSSPSYPPDILNHSSPSYQGAMLSNSVYSQKSSFRQSSLTQQNQKISTQHHVTPSASLTFQWKQQELNVMSSPVLNMTQPGPLKTYPSPIILSSPSSPTYETQSPPLKTSYFPIIFSSPSSPPCETQSPLMTIQGKQQEPNAMSSPLLNLIQSPPLKTSYPSPIILSSPSSPTYELQSPPITCREKQKPNSMSSRVLNVTQSSSLTSFPTSIPVSSSLNPINTNLDKLTMIKNFSNETGMNDKWTKKCLIENGWDYTKASLSFSRLKSSIPSIAYIR